MADEVNKLTSQVPDWPGEIPNGWTGPQNVAPQSAHIHVWKNSASTETSATHGAGPSTGSIHSGPTSTSTVAQARGPGPNTAARL